MTTMRTTIEMFDGTTEVHDDAAPTIDTEAGTVGLMDAECGSLQTACGLDELPFAMIRRVVFEVGERLASEDRSDKFSQPIDAIYEVKP